MPIATAQKIATKPVKKTKVIQTRLDADLVDRANKILEEIGLTSSDIFRILLKQVVNTGEVPLKLSVLSPSQEKQIDEAFDDIKNGRVYSFETQEGLEKFLETL